MKFFDSSYLFRTRTGGLGYSQNIFASNRQTFEAPSIREARIPALIYVRIPRILHIHHAFVGAACIARHGAVALEWK